MNKFPTSKENIALNIIFGLMGESRFDRTIQEYMEIATRLPPLKTLHHEVNKVLQEMSAAGYAPHDICHFKAGDEFIRFERFPTSMSSETIRSALTKSGMRMPKYRRKP